MRTFRITRAHAVAALVVLSALSIAATASAQDSPSEPPGVSTPKTVELRLADGSTIRGTLVEETAAYVVIENRLLGTLRIPREHIEAILDGRQTETAEPRNIETATVPEPGNFDPDHNSVLLGPTPETLPKGTGYFRSFEVLILNGGFAPTNDLNITVATLFPVTSGAGMISGGFKYRLLSRERHHVGLAAAGSATFVSDGWLTTLTGIIGVGNRRHSLNFSIHGAFVENERPGAFYIVSGDTQFAPSVKLLAEFGNSANKILDDEDFNGFVNLGFRMFWERTSFTLTGFRPLTDDTGDLIAFPLAMFARHW